MSGSSHFDKADDLENGVGNVPALVSAALIVHERSAPPPSITLPSPGVVTLSSTPEISSETSSGSPNTSARHFDVPEVPFISDLPAQPEKAHTRPGEQDSASVHKSINSRHLLTVKPAPAKVKAWLEFQFFMTTYRKFFIFVFTLNILGIILAATGEFAYGNEHTGAILLGNLLAAVLFRNELFIRILYAITLALLSKWPPLRVRLAATSALQHVGGIHSGCATSGLAWLLYKVIGLIKHLRQRNITAPPVVAMGIITNVAVLISVISAIPWVRNVHHNIFEKNHRFIGWLGIATTWCFVYLGNCYDPTTGVCERNARHLIGDQEFWFVLGMTILVIIPWACTRRLPVEVELPSKKVAIIKFQRGMQQGLLGRISRTTLMEYHVFGIISLSKNSGCHYMVCGVQGDFTRGLVEDPPKFLWTRQLKFAGVSNTSKLYRRGIRICTGTGIGSALSTCLQDDGWFLIWIGSDQIGTFGTTIYKLIVDNIPPERRILWDSKKLGGRPNTMALLEEVYVKWNAEVVIITSNDQGNHELMLGCRERGIPAFGTLFDF